MHNGRGGSRTIHVCAQRLLRALSRAARPVHTAWHAPATEMALAAARRAASDCKSPASDACPQWPRDAPAASHTGSPRRSSSSSSTAASSDGCASLRSRTSGAGSCTRGVRRSHGIGGRSGKWHMWRQQQPAPPPLRLLRLRLLRRARASLAPRASALRPGGEQA